MRLYETFLARLGQPAAWAFSRWGDGEWACLLGQSGRTCDGQVYSGALRRDLEAVLLSRPDYDLGLQGYAQRRMGAQITQWLQARGLEFNWLDADVFAHESISHGLQSLVDALRLRHVVLVAPERLRTVARLVPVSQHVVVSQTDAHADVQQTIVQAMAAAVRVPDPVVAVSAGPAAKVIVHALYACLASHRAAVLDLGSIWEPYVGLSTRSYHAGVMATRSVQ